MTNKNLLKILFIEDLASDVDLAVLELRKEKLKFEHTTVCTRVDLFRALKEFKPDLIISDYMMPAFNGLQALKEVKKFNPEIPFILYTGSINEETAVECIKAGADDYVIKEHLTRLPFAVKEALEQKLIEKEKKAADLLLIENEEKLQSIYRVAPVGMGLVVDRVFIEVNETFCNMTGYDRNELIGKSSEMIYPTRKEYEFVGPEKNRQIAEKGIGSVETRLKCKDGRILNIISSSTPLDPCDLTKGLTFTVLDITETIIRENELRKLTRAVEQNPVSIVITNLDGNIEYVNPRGCEITGYSRDELLGKNPRILSTGEMSKGEYKILWNMITSGKEWKGEFHNKKKNGELYWERASISPVKNAKDEITHFLGVKEDITEHRLAEDKLRNSEERLKILFDYAPDAYYLSDLKGNFIDGNIAAEKLMGYDKNELIGKSFLKLKLLTPKQMPRAAKLLIKNSLGKGTGPDEFVLNRKDGSKVPVEIITHPVKIKDKTLVLGLARDITERKRAEIALRESEEKFRSIMENSPDAIFITDQQGKYQYVNKAATDMLGFTSEEVQSKTILDLTPPDKNDEYFEIFKKVLLEGKVFTEIELLKKDGSFISTDLNSVLLPGGLVYGSCRDITERKQIQEELLKHRDHLEELVNERTEELSNAKKEAEEANKAKSEFLANMSHEIRTPMNAVLGYTELLSSMLVDQTQKDYINSIKSSGRSLLTLINDILDLSKIEAGKLEMEYEYVDTYSFFTEFERIFSLKVSEKGLKFILDITSGTPAGIYIDEARLRQIVFNLIGNAVKFTSEGKIVLKVFTENPQIVNYSKEKSEELIDLIIEVRDTGTGISKELQEVIFEPFVQGRDNKHHGGTGLGLTITRKLTALMDGTIRVQSEPGKGSIFTVRIPEIAYLRDFSKTTVDIQIDPSEIVFEKASILIADDVEHNRNYLRDALKNTRLKIVEAEDGIAAYKLTKEIVPDLIIADIRMPKMDGFQLLNKIKSDEKLKHIPVIAYSASVLKAQKERIHNSEFAGLLIKPVKVAELYLELMNFLPYKSIKTAEPDKPLSEVDLIGEITNLPGLIHSLETDFYTIWKTFALRQPIGEIRDFGKNLIQSGLDHNSGIITVYGKELISAADSFNIEAILKLIGKYKGIIESLKDSTKNLNHD
jgi:PAS domain S-box-containing protein